MYIRTGDKERPAVCRESETARYIAAPCNRLRSFCASEWWNDLPSGLKREVEEELGDAMEMAK